MAITYADIGRNPQFVGQYRVVRKRATTGASDTYATGGFSVSPSDFGLMRITYVNFMGPFRNGTNALIPFWDEANSKIMLFRGKYSDTNDGPLVEVPNATAVGSYSCDIEVGGV
jgi:hypothetical protein